MPRRGQPLWDCVRGGARKPQYSSPGRPPLAKPQSAKHLRERAIKYAKKHRDGRSTARRAMVIATASARTHCTKACEHSAALTRLKQSTLPFIRVREGRRLAFQHPSRKGQYCAIAHCTSSAKKAKRAACVALVRPGRKVVAIHPADSKVTTAWVEFRRSKAEIDEDARKGEIFVVAIEQCLVIQRSRR